MLRRTNQFLTEVQMIMILIDIIKMNVVLLNKYELNIIFWQQPKLLLGNSAGLRSAMAWPYAGILLCMDACCASLPKMEFLLRDEKLVIFARIDLPGIYLTQQG